MKRLKVMTEKEILDLRPTFIIDKMTHMEWFDITKGCKHYTIKSNTFNRNANIKSKYTYSDTKYGDKADELARTEFTIWWNNLNNLNK
jgi:trehalose utilization protein